MMNTKIEASVTTFVTPEARLSFPVLFEPRAVLGSAKLTYQVTLLFPPKTDFAPFIEVMKAAMLKRWQKLVTLPAEKNPIRDCATYPYRTQRYGGYDDGWKFIRTSSKYAPAIVNRMTQPVTDPSLVYAGMWVRAFLNAFAYDHPTGGRGVSFGLNALQLVRDGERLDGRPADPGSAFSPLGEEEAPGEGLGEALFG